MIVFSYYLAINVITFFVWGFDKLRAKLQEWRIPENTLYVLIILGGGVGALLGMTVFRHKTRKLKFKVISVVSVLVYIVIFFYFLR
ncbi:MAG: DUF1294 domain-containing protein [Chloroflexi bacterium HGW-Chloroflexi-3]|nr:MAG: DUF1294 domain-containing protein [Chloroflexi bacterium HGW-Chloroflexi-3]